MVDSTTDSTQPLLIDEDEGSDGDDAAGAIAETPPETPPALPPVDEEKPDEEASDSHEAEARPEMAKPAPAKR